MNDTNALATTQPGALSSPGTMSWSREQLDLLKRTVASGTTDDQFALFVEVARSVGLNPFQKQIYAVVRNSWNPATKRKEPTMTVQTGIDGFRLVAARTNAHIGSEDAEYGPDTTTGKLVHPTWARVTVSRLVAGHVATFTATARWSEYVQKDFEGNITSFWTRMPYLMLAKCAEALALRKAFPAELSGIYTREEMGQADNDVAPLAPPPMSSAREKAAPPPAQKAPAATRKAAPPKDDVIDAEVVQPPPPTDPEDIFPDEDTPAPTPPKSAPAPQGEADITQGFIDRIKKCRSVEALDLIANDMRAVYGSKSPKAVVTAYRERERQFNAEG